MSTIAFIESNTTGSGRLLLHRAKARGLKTLLIAAAPGKYSFLDEEMIPATILDTSNVKELVEFLSTIADLQAVLSSSESFVAVAAEVASALRLKGNQPKAIHYCRDKGQLAKILNGADIQVPQTCVVKQLEEIEPAIAQFTIPFVVKPNSGTGSRAVKLCRHRETGIAHAKQILQNGEVVLLQEYICGTEYSVETLTFDGSTNVIGITRKYLGEEPYFVEAGHDFPALLTVPHEQAIRKTVMRALAAVGFTFGAAHTELRLSPQGPIIIEINPRLAGGMIPEVIQVSLGIDLLDILLALHLDESVDLQPQKQQYAAIRFAIAPKEMILESILGTEKILQQPGVVAWGQMKQVGDLVGGNNDYRDRVAYLIAAADTHQTSVNLADAATASLQPLGFSIAPQEDPQSNTGRLHSVLATTARAIVFPPSSPDAITASLKRIITLDEAHLIMLAETGIVERSTVATLLRKIVALKDNSHAEFFQREAPRGLYMLYETILSEMLGAQVAGVLQTARSRNDMNATTFVLNVRDNWSQVYRLLWQLRSGLLRRAACETATAFPIYSQYQTALPGTLMHYLAAVEEALVRDTAALVALLPSINHCPLGTGAGGGTTWPIDRNYLATLLGFSFLRANSIDAVASRDLGIRYLSALNGIGLTLSRMAQDLQLWTTQEFALIELPDNLSGGSSMMPQKKNPYLLEWIKVRSLIPLGALTTLSATLAKTPFSNSYEVSLAGELSLKEATTACIDAIRVLNLIVTQMVVNHSVCESRVINGLTVATAVADDLVQRQKITFRAAHHKVGNTIRQAIDNNLPPLEALKQISPDLVMQSPLEWAHAFEYGGGPGEVKRQQVLNLANQRLANDATTFTDAMRDWDQAEDLRNAAIETLFKESENRD